MKKPTKCEFQLEITYCLVTHQKCVDSYERQSGLPIPTHIPVIIQLNREKYKCSSCRHAWESKN